MKDLIIIGSGPAGLTSAIYAKRAEIDALVIETAPASGGQIINTDAVDNYPGLPGINGFELGMKMRQHADDMGAEVVADTVRSIETRADGSHVVHGDARDYETRAVIIATGASRRKLKVPGEAEYEGRGVSFCAVCDGAFYRKKTAAVVGGGDAAVDDALYLSRICSKVYVVHRRDSFRAARSLSDKLKAQENVEIFWNSAVRKISGDAVGVTEMTVENLKDGSRRKVTIDGIFEAVGMIPNADFAGSEIKRDPAGYIEAGEDCRTSVPGIFAAGDVRSKILRQVVTAVADGAVAVEMADKYISSL